MRKNKNILFYLNKHKWAVTSYILFVILACVCSGVSTISFANFLSHITTSQFEIGIRILILAAFFKVVSRSSWWLSYYVYFKYSNIMWVEIAEDLTKRSFELSSSTFSDNDSGSFVQRIMTDPNNVLIHLSSLIEQVAEALTSFVIIIYIITLNWIIGLMYVVILFGLFCLEIYRRKVAKKNKLATKAISDKTYSIVNEIVKSEKDIKSLGLEDKLVEVSNANLNKMKDASYRYDMTDSNLWCTRNIIVDIFAIIVLSLGIHMMNINMLTLATYILLFTYKDNLYELIWSIGAISKNFTDAGVSINRMFSLYDEKLYKSDKFGTVEVKNIKGKIAFKNVKFAYSDVEEIEVKGKKGKTKKEFKHVKKEPIFNNLSFSIKPNTTVAFVGKSGSGKSTIASLIAKLNDVDGGQVLIDSHDIKDLSKETIRNNISMINQFPYIFDMSIKENLLMVKKDATDDELWDVLKRACFDEDVKAMPKGIETKVGETGVKLSGGQRQRLAIARALLKNSKIIIFDESTSSLDNFAQSHIQKSIEQLKGQHTIIIIAHRLSTIKNVDTIYFIEKGEIKGQGSFVELFENNQDFQNMFMIENI